MLQDREDLGEMFVGFYFGEDGFDFAFGINDKGGSFGAHVFFAIHAFFHPDAVGIDEAVVFITKNGEGEGVLFDELFVALHAVDADAEDFGFGADFCPAVA